MFGRFRKKVTKQTIEMVRQQHAIFQHHHGIPPSFWQDEFVIGYYGAMISFVCQVVSQGRLSQTDKGYVLQDGFEALSNMNGSAIARRFTELSFQQPQSATFKNGVDNGSIVTLAIFGKTDPQDREIVEAAEIEAARIGIPLPTYLMMSLFFEPVKERFGLD